MRNSSADSSAKGESVIILAGGLDTIPLLGSQCSIRMEVQVSSKLECEGARAAQGRRKRKQTGEVWGGYR